MGDDRFVIYALAEDGSELVGAVLGLGSANSEAQAAAEAIS